MLHNRYCTTISNSTEGSGEDISAYEAMLPFSPIANVYYPVSNGDVITITKHYGSGHGKAIDKKFKVIKIEKYIEEDTEEIAFYSIISVIPIEE